MDIRIQIKLFILKNFLSLPFITTQTNQMSMIRKYSSVLITDILVLSLLCSLSYIILHTFPLAPYSKSFSKFLNDTYFMMIPAGVYIAYRVYFQISFYILHLIRQYLQSKLQFLGNCNFY